MLIQPRIASIFRGALRPAKNDGEVVRWHIDHAIEHEAVRAGASRHFVQIAQPPARITGAQGWPKP